MGITLLCPQGALGLEGHRPESEQFDSSNVLNQHSDPTQPPALPWWVRMASLFIYLFLFFIFCFLGPHLQHMEVPRLGIESEL